MIHTFYLQSNKYLLNQDSKDNLSTFFRSFYNIKFKSMLHLKYIFMLYNVWFKIIYSPAIGKGTLLFARQPCSC